MTLLEVHGWLVAHPEAAWIAVLAIAAGLSAYWNWP